MVFSLALTIVPFILVIMLVLFMGTDFLYFFQKFRNICFQIYGLGQGWGTYLLS